MLRLAAGAGAGASILQSPSNPVNRWPNFGRFAATLEFLPLRGPTNLASCTAGVYSGRVDAGFLSMP